MDHNQRRLRFVQAAGIFVNAVIAGAASVVEPLVSKQPYHTSILTGEGWVQELLNGHPERIHTELGLAMFGSEPKFEPEHLRTEPKFGPRFRKLANRT